MTPAHASQIVASPDPAATSLAHTLTRLSLVIERLRRLVEQRRPQAFAADDPLRGMCLTVEHVRQLLDEDDDLRRLDPNGDEEAVFAEVETAADALEASGEPTRLRSLQRSFRLDRLDVELLLTAALTDLDPRTSPIIGFLNDDVANKTMTVATALGLVGHSTFDAEARSRLLPSGRLVRYGLVDLDDGSSFLGRSVRVAGRVTEYLLGGDTLDSALADVTVPAVATNIDAGEVARLLAGGADRIYLRDRFRGTARACGTRAAALVGVGVLTIDLDRVRDADLERVLRAAVRESLLRRVVLVLGPVDRWRNDRSGALPHLDTALDVAGPLILYGTQNWDPEVSSWTPVVLDAPELDASDWTLHLGADDLVDVCELAPFAIAPEQMERSVELARTLARAEARPLGTEHVRRGIRAHSSAGLESRARRLAPSVGLDDMVLRAEVRTQLDDLVHRVRHRDTVIRSWGMRPGGGRGRGVSALFAGDPGTGKTMSAEAVAHELGLEVYVVDLSTVVDKYIGETEKHLERIFEEADGVNGILLFDEADALFGKRSEVSDAHDRHANVEVAYLLQRMERFDGIALLTTNLRSNLDEAFTRRLDLIIDFPKPDEAERTQLWNACLGARLSRAEDVDLEFLGRSFELSGGSIRSVVISAAYRAAARDGVVRMLDVMEAVLTEYRKLGRLAVASEFGPWLEQLRR